ncbi:dolichyl-phosphate-mannose-protein mannosyltransferase [Neolewinella xylanilytica]|uniref:Dolichyl-phosphate-mannose-protein mannosyltransferase n=1 Tax=Neolewinella xylanilytica TaxID=1514080 RepID=A0A2S6I3C0_9BACT|nr:glycosyltransferase family 39 protein [Neolewinella xylanilytica]PPK85665.1 dolichyl-phosphate-mannose-protein mannosyltransferase [Neolewinella xylanilytica]
MKFTLRSGLWMVAGLSVLLSLALHWSILGAEIQGHHNWRQSYTMWNIYNFAYHDNDILSPRDGQWNGGSNINRLEFPIMQWGIAQVVRRFGHEILVSRLLVWVIGLVGLLGFYRLLRVMGFAAWLALAGTVFFQFSPVFYFYTVNVQPDLLALAAGIWYLYFVFAYFRGGTTARLIGAGLALMIATLAKLPFLMLSIVSIVYFVSKLFEKGQERRKLIGFAGGQLLLILPALAWYAWVMPTWNSSPALYGIFGNENTPEENLRILRHFYQHYITYDLLSPAVWVFFLLGVFVPARPRVSVSYTRYVWALALMTIVYVILQWNTITYVHDYYLLPLLPWMYIVVCAGAGRLVEWGAARGLVKMGYTLLASALVGSPIAAYTLRQEYWEESRSYHYDEFRDIFAYQEELQAAVDDDARVIVANDNSGTIFTWLIRKQAYVFAGDNLRPHWIKDIIDTHRPTHLYSNTRVVDENPEAAPYLDSLVLSRGNIRVYRLADPE